MSDYASRIIWALVACIIYLVYFLVCSIIKNSLRKKVAWCVCENLSEAIALNHDWTGVGLVREFVNPEYWLNINDPNEKEAAQFILTKFQEALCRSYFHDNLRCNYKIALLSNDEYCMMVLNSYLNGYSASNYFREYPVVAEKLLHITSEFCRKSHHISKLQIREL